MEIKYGIQTVHDKCYLCTKPGYSGAANGHQHWRISVRLNYCMQAIATVLFFFEVNLPPVQRGLCGVNVNTL